MLEAWLCLAACARSAKRAKREVWRENAPSRRAYLQGTLRTRASSPDALLSRPAAQPVQRLRRRQLLRARAAAQRLQGVRWWQHLRARTADKLLQGVRRQRHSYVCESSTAGAVPCCERGWGHGTSRVVVARGRVVGAGVLSGAAASGLGRTQRGGRALVVCAGWALSITSSPSPSRKGRKTTIAVISSR